MISFQNDPMGLQNVSNMLSQRHDIFGFVTVSWFAGTLGSSPESISRITVPDEKPIRVQLEAPAR